MAETLEGSKQEFDLTIRKLLTEIEEESNAHKDKQEQLNAEIASYKDEITSLIHFQEVLNSLSFLTMLFTVISI